MANVNKIILVGTVTKKPIVKFGMENNMSMATFTIAAARPSRNDGTYEEDFIPVTASGKNADYVAEYFQQGSMTIVEGRVQVRTIDNAGQREWITEVVATHVRAMENKTAGAVKASAPVQTNDQPAIAQNPFSQNSVTEDDIPF